MKHRYYGYKELNNINTELYINDIKKGYKKYFIPEKEGEYNIKLKFNINLTDCSYMFAGCEKIINISPIPNPYFKFIIEPNLEHNIFKYK